MSRRVMRLFLPCTGSSSSNSKTVNNSRRLPTMASSHTPLAFEEEAIRAQENPSASSPSNLPGTSGPSVKANGTTPSAARNEEEHQYLSLIRKVISTGQARPDRTGTGTLSIFAPPSLRFDLSNSSLPLLTTKRVFIRGVIEELLWFIKGSTDSNILREKGVHIWDGNGSREFLDKVGLKNRREGDLGPVYGFQWRHFGAEYEGADADHRGKGVDQLAECIRKIRQDPTDRRIIMSAWNPADLSKMALPPCHMFCQFYVHLPIPSSPSAPIPKPRLSLIMYQRSADLGLGVPFNIASYALLLHMVAKVTDTDPYELIMQLGDAHVYKDHVDALEEQLLREPREWPKLKWARENVGGIDDFKYEDFVVEGYKPMGKIEMKMSV